MAEMFQAGMNKGYEDAEAGRGLTEQGSRDDTWWAGYMQGQEEYAMDQEGQG